MIKFYPNMSVGDGSCPTKIIDKITGQEVDPKIFEDESIGASIFDSSRYEVVQICESSAATQPETKTIVTDGKSLKENNPSLRRIGEENAQTLFRATDGLNIDNGKEMLEISQNCNDWQHLLSTSIAWKEMYTEKNKGDDNIVQQMMSESCFENEHVMALGDGLIELAKKTGCNYDDFYNYHTKAKNGELESTKADDESGPNYDYGESASKLLNEIMAKIDSQGILLENAQKTIQPTVKTTDAADGNDKTDKTDKKTKSAKSGRKGSASGKKLRYTKQQYKDNAEVHRLYKSLGGRSNKEARKIMLEYYRNWEKAATLDDITSVNATALSKLQGMTTSHNV